MPKLLQYYIGGEESLRTAKSDYAIFGPPLIKWICAYLEMWWWWRWPDLYWLALLPALSGPRDLWRGIQLPTQRPDVQVYSEQHFLGQVSQNSTRTKQIFNTFFTITPHNKRKTSQVYAYMILWVLFLQALLIFGQTLCGHCSYNYYISVAQ